MKFTIFNYFFFCLLIFNQSCKNKDCTKNGTCPAEYHKYMLGEAKDYLWARPGSYWIYKNTKTGDMDTQICSAILLDTITKKGTEMHSKHITVEYERLRRTIQSSFNKWVYYEETSKYNPDGLRELKCVVDRSVSGEGNIVSFFHPFKIDSRSGTGSSNVYYKGMDTTLKVQGKTYQNVARFELDIDDIWYPNDHPIGTRYPNSVYYWAKDIGLIKRQNKSENYSWELVDYHIIQ